jgi:hypothetical protein
MNRIFRNITVMVSAFFLSAGVSKAGNEDRAGQAGASYLLINPWARSAGWNGAGSANTKGLEAQFVNVAGLAFTQRTEIQFSQTQWLSGSGINISAFGLAQRLGKNGGVMGLTVTSMNFGDIPVTTTDNPEGTGATYSPRYLNIGLSYAKSFSDRIHAGITARVLNESIANVTASGFSIDAGVQYVTTVGADKKKNGLKKDNIVFGITLKNIGPRMRFNGDGLSTAGTLPTGANLTVDQRSSEYEIPATLSIGLMYRARFNKSNKLTAAFNFSSNSFTRDQFTVGLEYSWKEILMLRGGYTFENGVFGKDRSSLNSNLLTALTGPAAGATVDIPLGKTKEEKERKFNPKFGLDYSYRATYAFRGIHTFGARITL